jgi:hypothetical protein
MDITVTAGWWILPLAVTAISFSLAVFVSREDGSHGDYSAIAGAFVSLVLFGAAAIVSLVAWLIWALAA